MIDIFKESPVPLGKASQLLPDKPSPATLWRWHARGVNGIRLETAKIGKRRYTSREALQRFVTATTEADSQVEPAISPKATERDAATTRRLRNGGLLAPETKGPVERPADDETNASGTEVPKE